MTSTTFLIVLLSGLLGGILGSMIIARLIQHWAQWEDYDESE